MTRVLGSAALVVAMFLWASPARAQSCPSGTLLCAAGWCCPPAPNGGTNVCCNSNPQSLGCTSNGLCGSGGSGGSGGGGFGGSTGGGGGCPSSAPLQCAAGWCCPYGNGGSTQVCCNSNPQSSGCTLDGNCGGGGSGGSTGSGCGTHAAFDIISCGSGWCPANSSCTASGGCQCDPGYKAEDCNGNLCNGGCTAPYYSCVYQGTPYSSGGSSGSGGGGTTTTTAPKPGCDVAQAHEGGFGALGWLAGLVGLGLLRRRRHAGALVALLLVAGSLAACAGQGAEVGVASAALQADPPNPAHVPTDPATPAGERRVDPALANMCLPGVDPGPAGPAQLTSGVSAR